CADAAVGARDDRDPVLQVQFHVRSWNVFRPLLLVAGFAISIDLNDHARVDDPDGKRAQIFGQRRAHRLTRAYVEASLMQWTLDRPILEKAIAWPRVSVRADVVGGVDVPVDRVERDLAPARLDCDDVVVGKIRMCRYIDPAFRHGMSPD